MIKDEQESKIKGASKNDQKGTKKKELSKKEQLKLVEDVKKNKRRKEFVKQYSGYINFAVRIVINKKNRPISDEEFEYIRLDVYIKVFRLIKNWDPEKGRALGSWIGLIAIRVTFDYLRKKDIYQTGFKVASINTCGVNYEDKNETLSSNILDEINEHNTIIPDFDNEINLKTDKNRILNNIKLLKEDEQMVITFILNENLKNREIAEKMKISNKEVSQIKKRAIIKLKNYFNE